MKCFTYHLIKARYFVLAWCILACATNKGEEELTYTYTLEDGKKPNILFVISDDQSYPHASIYGEAWVQTPAFDRIAREGALFHNAFAASPGCSPSRAALLTGMYCWQLEDAGTHASEFPAQYTVYPDILEDLGYRVGYTRKGWGPGNWEISGRTRNPAGDAFQSKELEPPTTGISNNDYAANFAEFLEGRDADQPFCFWYGASEPHRVFEKGSGLNAGKDPSRVRVPPFLPDTPEIRSDLLDYALEIEWFDKHLAMMVEQLEEMGELDNTIIVVTSDNGMAFPRAKANLYEYGFHVPLAIRWGNKVKGNRNIHDLVSLIDLAPTFLEAASGESFREIQQEYPMEGKSLMNILLHEGSGKLDAQRKAVFSARERHSSSRWNNLTYPQRAIRTERFLYTRNFKPERWPAGAPQKYEQDGSLGPMHGAYHDIDACPTFDYLVENREDPAILPFFEMAVQKRPEEEFFDLEKDPFCLTNVAEDPAYKKELLDHRESLGGYLMRTGDPRISGNGDIYEMYVRYSPIREFPEPDWISDDELYDLSTK
ncbi:sulfatase family protein [Pleomorphovibrio marinus]|uniref:sulfatase family protein n=1 Tax=Pleomorphovibrio marinus TaxID=2164132 RepID=UPI000E0C5932|nr:sulfatase [Pleomorphovibrio marinus]